MLMTLDEDQIYEMAQDWLDKTVNRNNFSKRLVSVEPKYIDHKHQWVLVLEDDLPEEPLSMEDDPLIGEAQPPTDFAVDEG